MLGRLFHLYPRLCRALLLLLAGAILLGAGLISRMLFGARQEIRAALAAAARGDDAAQLRYLRRAMAYYLPGNPGVRRARDLLLQAAQQAEAHGNAALALDALWQLRSAILSLRGLTQPYASTLPEVNRRIADLTAREAANSPRHLAFPGRSQLLHRLENPPQPHPGWAALGLLGFLIWISGVFLGLGYGVRPDASLRKGWRFWPLAGLAATGATLFCLGMAYA